MAKERIRKDKKIKNRVHKNYKFKWARGTINIHAIVDLYPAGNIVTYRMSVVRFGEVIEKLSFSDNNSSHMMERIEYYKSLPKEFEVTE